MPEPTKIAVIVVLESSGYWLMLKRSYPPNRGLYTPVGGKIEDGESPHAAAIREAQEEAGIQLENVGYCGLLVDSSPSDYNWICFVYRARVDYFSPPDCNEGILTWVAIESLTTLPTPVTDKYLYPRVLSNQPFFLNALYSNENNLIELTEEISNTQLFPE
jgi:8-oxo-dGTP diphosphatase